MNLFVENQNEFKSTQKERELKRNLCEDINKIDLCRVMELLSQ